MHVMNREVIPSRKKRLHRCPLCPFADTLISNVKVLAVLAWLKQIDHWLVQHTAPARR